MPNNFQDALNKLGECVELVGKGLEDIVEDLSKNFGTEKKDTCIRIKRGSRVCIGEGIYAILENDVEAILVKGPGATSANKENT